jgi:cob(I)alamin adenosyltransferase
VPGEGQDDRLRMADAQCARLEAEIAEMNAALPPLRSFVLPGGTPAAAHAHLARTTARRAERVVVALGTAEAVNPVALRYLNRLSDHLFVLSRRLNAGGDVLWVPGQGRG